MLWGNGILALFYAACAFVSRRIVARHVVRPEPSRFGGRELMPQPSLFFVLESSSCLPAFEGLVPFLPLASLTLFSGPTLHFLLMNSYADRVPFLCACALETPRNINRFFSFLRLLVPVHIAVLFWSPSSPISRYRDPESVSTFGRRHRIVRHLTSVTLHHHLGFGIGILLVFHNSRPKYPWALETAHLPCSLTFLFGAAVQFLP